MAEAVRKKVKLHHPDNDDLAFLYGTIITDGQDLYSDQIPTANLTVCANREVSTIHAITNRNRNHLTSNIFHDKYIYGNATTVRVVFLPEFMRWKITFHYNFVTSH